MAAVEATFTKRTGEKKEFYEQAQGEKNLQSLEILRESVLKIQKDINETLTEVVNEERQASGDSNQGTEGPEDDGADDDDDDDEKDDKSGENRNDVDGEPAAKKPKT